MERNYLSLKCYSCVVVGVVGTRGRNGRKVVGSGFWFWVVRKGNVKWMGGGVRAKVKQWLNGQLGYGLLLLLFCGVD